MKTIFAEDIDEAYYEGMSMLLEDGVWEDSQRGRVLVMPEPVTTVYTRPNRRVLFNQKRDANPFFHLVEAVWMLAGERNATFLDRYVKDFSVRFGETGGDIHGAYGYRWRNHFDEDQIPVVGKMLFESPRTRRAVLTMWDPNFDLDVDKNDIPCNTQIFFRVKEDQLIDTDGMRGPVLDMLVTNRSNDTIWGAYGANAVHMSVLHEVMAGLAGVDLGTYHQMSFNFHAYEPVLAKMAPFEPTAYVGEPSPIIRATSPSGRRSEASDLLAACKTVINTEGQEETGVYWLDNTVRPMMMAHRLWKEKDRSGAINELEKVQSTDWRAAAKAWFERRAK